MELKEKISNKKRELAEKRSELKKLVEETRADVAAESSTLSAEEIKKVQKQITTIEESIKSLVDDVNALESISPLLEDPDEAEGTDGDADDKPANEAPAETDACAPKEEMKSADEAPAAAKAEGKIPVAKETKSRIITAEERGMIPKMHNVADKRNADNVRSFEKYIRSRGEVRDTGVMSTDAGYGAIVPVQYLNAADQPLPANSLAPLVNKVAVNYRMGHFPIFKRQTVGMSVVNELDPNAVTANPEIIDVTYDVKTYRQQLNVSQEMIDDSNVDITGKIANYINEQKYLTEQYAIGHIMAAGDVDHPVTPVALTATAATASSLVDQIKEQFNVALNIAYTNRAFVATQSAFQILDTLKDGFGRYLVQSNVTDSSQKTLLGVPLVVVQDIAMGANGDKLLWLGDPKMYVAYFHKADTTARWFAGYNYELQLYAFYRADFKVADNEAGITMSLDVTA